MVCRSLNGLWRQPLRERGREPTRAEVRPTLVGTPSRISAQSRLEAHSLTVTHAARLTLPPFVRGR